MYLEVPFLAAAWPELRTARCPVGTASDRDQRLKAWIRGVTRVTNTSVEQQFYMSQNVPNITKFMPQEGKLCNYFGAARF